MVTVAKNNAVTMLLGGAIGYDLSAAAVGNTVVLSAGRDVVNGDAVMTGAAAGSAASIQLTNAKLTTRLIASASGDVTLLAQGDVPFTLLGDTLAVADGTVTMRASAGTINASGNVTLQSARFGLTAGTAQVIANNGRTDQHQGRARRVCRRGRRAAGLQGRRQRDRGRSERNGGRRVDHRQYADRQRDRDRAAHRWRAGDQHGRDRVGASVQRRELERRPARHRRERRASGPGAPCSTTRSVGAAAVGGTRQPDRG